MYLKYLKIIYLLLLRLFDVKMYVQVVLGDLVCGGH